MAVKGPEKKRVRIQMGHEARYIPRRNNLKKYKQKRKAAASVRKVASRVNIGKARIHRPTVAELVYQFLERLANKSTVKSQKTNATAQFRKFHRNKKLKPNGPRGHDIDPSQDPQLFNRLGGGSEKTSLKKKVTWISEDVSPWKTPKDEPDGEAQPPPSTEVSERERLEKLVFEILTLGAMLGFLEPGDQDGLAFRVVREQELLDGELEASDT